MNLAGVKVSGPHREGVTEGAKGPGSREFKLRAWAVRLCGKGMVTVRMTWL